MAAFWSGTKYLEADGQRAAIGDSDRGKSVTVKIYEVGGAVRDLLLGLPVVERDWVVVGATPEQMIAEGYRAVGRDFPVFLHPATGEEYALARTERKSGPGYRGFVVNADPSVSLEEDLGRLPSGAAHSGARDRQRVRHW